MWFYFIRVWFYSTIVASCILYTTWRRVGAFGKLLAWHGARSPAYVETAACFVGLVLLAGTGPRWAVLLKWLTFIRSRRWVSLCFNVLLCPNVYGLQVSHKQNLLHQNVNETEKRWETPTRGLLWLSDLTLGSQWNLQELLDRALNRPRDSDTFHDLYFKIFWRKPLPEYIWPC